MKIQSAKQMYAAQRSSLWKKSQDLAKLLEKPEQSGLPSFDRVGISRELSLVNAQYEAVDEALAGITAMESKIFGVECSRRQAETEAEMAEDTAKIMEVYRRVASGAKVPVKDQQKLMDYDMKLYMAAKQAALMAQSDETYKSLWEDGEEGAGERKTPEEAAADTDISVPHPSAVAASVELPDEETV